MPHLEMEGPHYLVRDMVSTKVPKASPGVYALGRMKDDGNYLVQFVGRSDTDLNSRLLRLADDGRYPEFKYLYAESAPQAFDMECRIFHYFAPEDNRVHPTRPKDTDWKCPKCAIYGE